MKKIFLLFTIILISCQANAEEKLNVFVSILPQKFFAEQIAKDIAKVSVLVGSDQSPHSYEPLPKQMAEISRADVFFTVGVPFEKQFIKRITSLCPNLKIVATDEEITKRPMEEADEHEHHSHEHKGNLDPHIWLDPILAIQQAQTMANTFKELKPDKAHEIDNNFNTFKAQTEQITKEISEKLSPLKGETMLVFHPAFGYIAERFGLVQRSVEVDGKEPAPRQLASLIKKCKKENIHVIFVQKQFPVAAAKTVASSINGSVVLIDPLAENMFENLKNIADSLTNMKK